MPSSPWTKYALSSLGQLTTDAVAGCCDNQNVDKKKGGSALRNYTVANYR
jgi:hypothetical protein